MDQRLNPYTPGSGIKPKRLAGRDGDLEAFGVLLERLADGQPERSLIYSGLRGVGKDRPSLRDSHEMIACYDSRRSDMPLPAQ